jgi:hypothetical protein
MPVIFDCGQSAKRNNASDIDTAPIEGRERRPGPTTRINI